MKLNKELSKKYGLTIYDSENKQFPYFVQEWDECYTEEEIQMHLKDWQAIQSLEQKTFLTEPQIDSIKEEITIILGNVITDWQDREEIVKSIYLEVCGDIEETADWSNLDEDEYCISDIEISLARVIKKKLIGE